MISDVLTEATEKMAKAVEVAKDDFSTVRTGRINAALFQKIPVEYYGTPTPLAQLASLQTPEARTLIVTPYDKSALKEIERAIATFPNLGASPSNDGEIVRVTIPELTQDRRKEFVKLVRGKGGGPQGRHPQHPSPREGRPRRALKGEISDDEISRGDKDHRGPDEEARRSDRRRAEEEGSRTPRGLMPRPDQGGDDRPQHRSVPPRAAPGLRCTGPSGPHRLRGAAPAAEGRLRRP